MASNFPFGRKALEAWTVYACDGLIACSGACFNPDTITEYSIYKKWSAEGCGRMAPTCGKASKNEKNINRLAAGFSSACQSQIDVRPLRVAIAQMFSRVASSGGVRRCFMPDIKSAALLVATAFGGLSAISLASAQEQSAIDAAQELAQMLDETSVEISGDYLLSALEGAAAAGEPMALWQLGVMYESGIGVEKDQGKAFGYFAQIANENAEM